jgi:predicted transcriptional regulator
MANQRTTTSSDAWRVQGWAGTEQYAPRNGEEGGTARSVMRPVPFVVNASDPLLDILSLTLLAMRTPIPVVDDHGMVVGALRAREIETLLLAHEDDEAWMIDLSARSVMVSPVTILPVETALAAVAHAVKAHAFKFVFVGRGRRVVGVITEEELEPPFDRSFSDSWIGWW